MVLYGICNFSCQIQVFPNFLDINAELSIGYLVEIVDTQTEKYGIRIPKLSNQINHQSDFYLCSKDKLILIEENVVPFLMAISDLNHRISMARRTPQMEFITGIKVGHVAAVYGTLFNERKYFECRVKYIGAVPELGQGSFIGVEFLHGEEKPQRLIPLTIIEKYVKCVGYKGVITTANWMISIQNYRKMNLRQNSGIQHQTSVKSSSDPIMDSFMEKFSQFLSTANNQSQIISNTNTSSTNSMFSENFLQTANDFYSQRQKSMNRSLSSSQTSLNSAHENDSNRNLSNNRRNRSRKNSGAFVNIPSLMDIPINENVVLENCNERKDVVDWRHGADDRPRQDVVNWRQKDDHRPRQDNVNGRQREDHRPRQDDVNWRQEDDHRPRHEPRKRLSSEEEKYNNQWNGCKFIIYNSIYKNRCTFCANPRDMCEFKKEGYVSEIVPFQNQFRCKKCYKMHERTEMIVVKRCFHVFGKKCLAATVDMSNGSPVHCPAKLRSVCHTIFSEDDLMSFLTDEEKLQYMNKKFLNDFKTIINIDNLDNRQQIPLHSPSIENNCTKINETEMSLFQYNLIPNCDEFKCPLCLKLIPELKGVSLQQCFHNFCKECLAVKIQMNKEARVKCPFHGTLCEEYLLDLEIKELVSSEVYNLHLDKSIYQYSVDNGEKMSFEDYLESLKPVLNIENNFVEVASPALIQTVLPGGMWKCTNCELKNYEKELNCFVCKSKNPNPSVTKSAKSDELIKLLTQPLEQVIEVVNSWDCPLCSNKNTENEINCKLCTFKNPDLPNNHWTCEICEQETNVSRIICDFCTSVRPVPKITVSSEIIEKWICEICGDENKETQNRCRFCNIERPKPSTEYEKLLTLEEGDFDLVENLDDFECPICLTTFGKGEGILLRECLHVSCKECLAATINMSETPEIKCPNEATCNGFVQDREIRAAITKEEYENYLMKGLNLAEKVIKDSYHCLTVDCKGWWVNEEEVNTIICPVCEIPNCLNCNAIHKNLTCKQYQDKLFNAPDAQAQRTKETIEVLLRDGSAIRCPNCGIIIQRTDGCDWLTCSCRTEICWATKGPRWGPLGKGDTSGGCRCKINGKLCTPTCRNCH